MAPFCCYSGTRCVRGPFVADGAEPDDTLAFPISIGKSVGLGAPNDSEDVKTIQKALNRFPESMGGLGPNSSPTESLADLRSGRSKNSSAGRLASQIKRSIPESARSTGSMSWRQRC